MLIALFCFAGPLVYHTDQIHNDILNANQPPSRAPPAGHRRGRLRRARAADGRRADVARDRRSAPAFATVLGTLWGAIAGYVGGMVDGFMMRIVDALLAIPALFLLLFLVAVDHAERVGC